MTRAIAIVLLLAACGDDEGGGGQPNPNATPATAAVPGAGSGSGKGLSSLTKIEERVECPGPALYDAKGIAIATVERCDPKAPDLVGVGGKPPENKPNDMHCDTAKHEYCLATWDDKGKVVVNACGTCPERDAIRHRFAPERDFVVEVNRDPFQSYIVRQPGLGSADQGLQKSVTQRCLKKDQFQASNYSYKDLKPVGVVAQGTFRKVLMMDPGNLGHIVKAKDCVGKEKAVVVDIGDEFICFQSEDASTGQPAPTDCRPLREKTIALSSQPSDATMIEPGGAPQTTITPVEPPPATLPPRTPDRAPAKGGGTTITPVMPPTTIKP